MDKKLLKKFINGQCTSEEVRAILKWYNSEDADICYSDEIEKLVKRYNKNIHSRPFDKDKVLEKVMYKIQNDLKKDANQRTVTTSPIHKNYAWLRVAALIIFVFSAVLAIHHITKPLDNTNPIANPVAWISKSTLKGQKMTIHLKDGSAITMNAGTTIRYPDKFSDSSRIVHLVGEAFFEVAHDPERPFTIISRGVSTTALGTSFNINAYKEHKDIRIALRTGRIKVAPEDGTSTIVSKQNTGVIYSPFTNKIQNHDFDPQDTFLWKDDILYFKSIGLDELIQRLEMWYGVNFSIENRALAEDKVFTGTFENESLDNVLTGLSFSKNFIYEIKNDQVNIKFN